MPQPVLVRFAVLTCSAVTACTAGALLAPAAHDQSSPPGLSDSPTASAVVVHAASAEPSGRKLR